MKLTSSYKILQIIPSDGEYRAVIENKDDDQQIFCPVIGWALVENDNGQRIVSALYLELNEEERFNEFAMLAIEAQEVIHIQKLKPNY
jgi:hypothetical protein